MNIWINQGFSMRTLAAEMVRARPQHAFHFSAKDAHAQVRDVAPVFWQEPASIADGYVDWLLDTARANQIDVLVGQRGRRQIAAEADRFAAAGIRVALAADAATLDLLDDKAGFTADLGGDPHVCRTIRITDADAFAAAVREIATDGASACVKPNRGIYGAGYWTLDATDPFHHLRDPDAKRIAADAYAHSLRASGEPIDLLVMEHLPGIEASVDIVADHGATLLAGVREKLGPNRQRIRTRHELLDHVAYLVRRYRLHGANNVQYKRDRHGAWKVLEINTRPAGGAAYLDAVGIPFAATWADTMAGDATAFDAGIDREIVAVTRAEPRRAPV